MEWGGGLPRKGVVAEKFVPSLESLSSLGWDVPGILPGCPGPLGAFKKFMQRKFVRIFRYKGWDLDLFDEGFCSGKGLQQRARSPETDQLPGLL